MTNPMDLHLGTSPNNNQPSALDGYDGLESQAPDIPAISPEITEKDLREFAHPQQLRAAIYDKTLAAAQAIQPVQNNRYKLSVTDVHYADPDHFDLTKQKQALLSGGSIGRRLRGTWVLEDAAGNTLGSKTTTLARIPHLTDRGTFINNANEYSLVSQLRLRPGIYTRKKANGEIEAHANVTKGPGHKLFLDPKTGVFKLGMQQSEMPVVTLLRAMGVNDAQLRDAWGNELAAANMRKDDAQVITKLHKKLVHKVDPDKSPSEQVVDAFHRMELDPEVSARTLGHPYTNMTSDAILATTKKLLAISRNEQETDDRDAMPFQTLHGPEDLLAERLSKSRGTMNKLLWKASAKGELGSGLSGAFDDDVKSALLTSGLGQVLEEVNLGEVLDQQNRVSRMGEGGITSGDSVPEESRALHPSQFGFIDILRTAESSRAGVDLRLANSVRKGPNNTLYTKVIDRAGNPVYRKPIAIADSVLAFPGEMESDTPYVRAIKNGRVTVVKRDDVDYTVPHMEGTLSPMANLIPGKSAVKGQRLVMASRMMQQALPLKEPEAPFVQSANPDKDGESFEETYSKFMGAVKADQRGRVMAVSPDHIEVKYADGDTKKIELANNFPLNRKTMYTQTAAVQPGDFIQPGQLLAHSNFTDKQGVTALGKNLRIAYMPYDGRNWEDAVVISESAAKKFTSEHAYKHDHEFTEADKPGRARYISIFPGKYNKETLSKFDEKGAIKPGTTVKAGDPLLLMVSEKERNKKSMIRGNKSVFQDKSILWDHDYDGQVTDVIHTPKGMSVVVKAYKPTQVGDKLSPRYGDKGIISHIVPDEQMIHDADGKPYEMLVSPLGLTSRINPMQYVENALGKITEKTGKTYKIKDFDGNTDLAQYAADELKKHGLSDTETVIDPRTGRKIPGIVTGNRWVMKLHHMAADKLQGRGLGSYDATGAPAGKTETSDSSKRLGMLEVNAIMSSGATNVLREAGLLRGQANPQYWSEYMSGLDPKTPEVPFVYDKFVNMLKAAGINPVRNGPKTQLMALTDADIDKLAGNRELKNAETVNWKDMAPVDGGLFSQDLTGGHGSIGGGGGSRWSYMSLHTPLPNPVMAEPIRRVLGLTKPQFENIIASKDSINGETGPQAIHNALKKIDVTRELAQVREQIKSGKKTKRDDAIRKIGYLKTAERLQMHPSEWMLSKVPVIPPIFRPVSVMGSKKLPLVDDANYLYKELWDANQTVKNLSKHLDPKDYGDEMLATYKAFQAVTGLGDPLQAKNKERGVAGILKHVLGAGGPKSSMIQRKLLGSTTDFVTRGVIAPNPDLHMDQVALPEEQAWDMYQPMLVRRMVRSGMSKMDALRAVEQRQPVAKKALDNELEDGVVLFNRAPTLHRYGIMAAKPVLTKNKIIELPTFVYAGLGADNDGDQMNIHALTTQSAKDEAMEKMLPSKNLFNVSEFKVHQLPSKDYVAGLYAASTARDDKNQVMYFDSPEAAIRAYKAGRIDLGRRVKILDKN